MSILTRLANRIEHKTLLERALKDNKGHGVNVHFNGQHFGWFHWDAKTKTHKEYSIADFKNKDTVGHLEKDVAKLKNINLEDYK